MRFQGQGQPLEPASDHYAARIKKIVEDSAPTMPLPNCHKPWPGRKMVGKEEVVKYMSSVPGFLRPQVKGDDVQDKALKVGVLDWGHLEKLTYLKKQVANGKVGESLSRSSVSSSPFSTSGSSSRSDRRVNSPIKQRKQSPSSLTTQNSSGRGRQSRMVAKESSVSELISPDPRTSQDKTAVRHNHERGNFNSSVLRYVSRDKLPSSDTVSLSGTVKNDDKSAFAHNRANTQIGRSNEAESSLASEQHRFHGNLYLAEKELSDRFLMFENVWDRLQVSFHERHSSYDSAVNDGRSIEVRRNRLSGNTPSKSVDITNQPPRISYSGPLPSTSQGEGPSTICAPLAGNEVLSSNLERREVKLERCMDDLSEKLRVNMAGELSLAEVKVTAAPRRELSPHRLLRAGLNRFRNASVSPGRQARQVAPLHVYDDKSATSNRNHRRSPSPNRLLSAGLNLFRNSSSREDSSGEKMNGSLCSDDHHEDTAASNIRSRRNPLRRILDPLKPRNPISFSGPITSLATHRVQVTDRENLFIRDELKSASEPWMPPEAIDSHSTRDISETRCSVYEEKEVTSTRQALLKLAWKNGLPLFVFYSSDINTLAATRRKGSAMENDCESTYMVFTAHERKKKVGIWTSQMNKNAKHDLVYNVVGQIVVSSSKPINDISKNCFSAREYVLYGAEQISTTHDHATSLFRNELAAIVIKVQNERPENDNHNLKQSSPCRGSSPVKSTDNKQPVEILQDEQKNTSSKLQNVVVILPSAAHGISSTGEPSPLIQRWKSGGRCDCGGWDEGCMLTVLTGMSEESGPIPDQASSANVHLQIELFTQGGIKVKKHAFSMSAFKEGIYTVDFATSISSLQAFAMCIATLHNQKAITTSGSN